MVFANCRTDLNVGGEARAAHTGAACVTNDVDDLLGGQGIHVLAGLAIGAKGVLKIILDHDRKRGHAAGTGAGLDRNNRARNTGVDGSAEACGGTDQLTDGHSVALLDHGLTGCADVHGHRNHDLGRGLGELLDRFLLSSFLVFGGVDAAVKLLLHSITSVFSLPNSLIPQNLNQPAGRLKHYI